jgi:secreted trypsin-like serine protease
MKASIIVLLGFLVAEVYSQAANDALYINPSGCGRRPLIGKRDVDDDKIVGGTTARVGDWGWQILLYRSGSFICGGQLINSGWVLTAAHCTTGSTAGVFTIDIGIHDRNAPESWVVRRTVSRLIQHPSYNNANYNNDISLLKLSATVTYRNEIVPICIPDSAVNSATCIAGKTSFATGWGTTSSGGSTTRYLTEVSMPIMTETACRNVNGNNVNYALYHVCAGGSGKDSCQGDSGGPLVVLHTNSLYYLCGLTSWGIGCGNGGVYTRISSYTSWISSTILNN